MSIINILIESLAITNGWVFIYTHLLKYLNVSFPASSPSKDFIRMPIELAPEPYEIPLYLVLTILTVIAVFFYYRFVKAFIKDKIRLTSSPSVSLLLKLFSLLVLGGVFLKNLGAYPLAHEIPPYQNPVGWQMRQIILLLYLLTLSMILVESAILQRLITQSKKVYILFSLFVIAFLFFVTFEPRFPMFVLDYSLVFGPIREIAYGKTIYTQVPSLYGFLSILVLGLLYNLKILNIWYLPGLVWILYVVQYFLCFYLIYKISKSITLSLLALFSILTLNYFSLFHLAASIPQVGPFRWLPLVLAIFLFYKIKKIDSKKFIFSVALLSFWNIDIVGISLLFSYFFTLFLLLALRHIRFKQFIKSIAWMIFSLLAIFFLIQAIHVTLGLQPVDLSLTLVKIREYARAGFGMWPIDQHTYFWLVLLTYFASIIYFFKNAKQTVDDRGWKIDKEARGSRIEKFNLLSSIFKVQPSTFYSLPSNNLQVLLFSANLSFFSSIYFIGRSHPHNLFHISMLFLLNLFLLLGILFNSLTARQKLILCLTVFTFFIAFPAYQRQESMADLIKKKLEGFARGDIFIPETRELLQEKYQKDIELIKTKLPEEKILILSDDDTYLFYLTDKQNLMNYNPQMLNFTKNDFPYSLKEAVRQCPKKLVGDCRLFGKCQWSDPAIPTNLFIQPLLLTTIEQECHVAYEAVVCTEHLCIAQSQKQ